MLYIFRRSGLLATRAAAILFAAGLVLAGRTHAQDIPLFSQKLTNSFLYNPAVAGLGMGSLTYSYRNNYSGVNGAPDTHFISAHTPVANYRVGVGVNMFQEQVSALSSTYFSGAFAYHIPINPTSTFSLGISGEYNYQKLRGDLASLNSGDKVLSAYGAGMSKPDFSFGVSYKNSFLHAGISANRLYTAWFEEESKKVLASYYSAFVQGTIRLDAVRSIIEPFLGYRKLSTSNNMVEAGTYYTYADRLTAGLGLRSNSILSATVAYRLTPKFMIGYSREMLLGAVGGYTGASNEFVMRIDFSNRASRPASSNFREAMSYRKKTMHSSSGPKNLHKSMKKLKRFSPNKRYQSNKQMAIKRDRAKKSNAHRRN